MRYNVRYKRRPMLLETRYEHIILEESGQPTIVGTAMKV
jgi:hypothetical protein